MDLPNSPNIPSTVSAQATSLNFCSTCEKPFTNGKDNISYSRCSLTLNCQNDLSVVMFAIAVHVFAIVLSPVYLAKLRKRSATLKHRVFVVLKKTFTACTEIHQQGGFQCYLEDRKERLIT